MVSRFIKAITFTANKEDVCNIENDVNEAVRAITKCGGKVINHSAHNLGISPMYLIYTIIYERESSISETEYIKAKGDV